jgi:general secretion pathway protein D
LRPTKRHCRTSRIGARDLDRVTQVDPQRSLFYYGVRNTTAESLAGVLNAVLAGNIPARGAALTQEPAVPVPPPPGAPPGLPPAQPPPGAAGAPPGPAPGNLPARIVTDPARNAIIFQGSAEEFAQLRPLIESLDQAAREAIIEATVAEVTLADNETLGTEWQQRLYIHGPQPGGGHAPHPQCAGGQQPGQGALNPETPGAQWRRGANSGRRASADRDQPGDQFAASAGRHQRHSADHPIPRHRCHPDRKTDHLRGNHIDLEIKQEVSEAVQNNTSGLSTPVINNRTVNTQLSLQDGATVLLGGLIMENASSTSTGIPGLKDIPALGFLFGTQQVMKTRSELFVFITPYIIQSGEDAERLAETFKNRYQSMPQPASTLHW